MKKKKPTKKKQLQSYVLLNCDDHASFLRRHGRDPATSRPDIAHQALLALLDSPLAKAGKIKALYLTTAKNVVVRINPAVRLPRTFKRFCGLFSQLLQKLSVRASNGGGGSDKLLKVVKGPVSMHLPPGCPRVALSRVAPDSVSLREFVRRELSGGGAGGGGGGGGERRAGNGAGGASTAAAAAAAGAAADNSAAFITPVFIVGAHSHGQATVPYADRWISISDYPLSAACVLARITGALEEAWGIS